MNASPEKAKDICNVVSTTIIKSHYGTTNVLRIKETKAQFTVVLIPNCLKE